MKSPWETQQDILKLYEESNNSCIMKAEKLREQGHYVYSIGEFSGPYVTYNHYYWTNGESILFVSSSRLTWVPLDSGGY